MASDVAVVPSHVEPLGNATMEAMSHVLPVVGCSVGWHPRDRRARTDRPLVPAPFPDRLAAAIARMIADRPPGSGSGARTESGAKSVQPPGAREGGGRGNTGRPSTYGRPESSYEHAPGQRESPAPGIGGSSRWFWEIYRRLPRDQFLIAVGRGPCSQDEFDRTHDLRLVRMPLDLVAHGAIRSIAGR